MYKMLTGENLFAASRSMEHTTFADSIRDERDEAYSDKTGEKLQPYLRIVDEKVNDPTLQYLIKECLTSRRGQYKIMQRKFKAAMRKAA
jgi:hypothetical protein